MFEWVTAKIIHQDLVAYRGPDFVAYLTIGKWRKNFNEGRMDIEDKPMGWLWI